MQKRLDGVEKSEGRGRASEKVEYPDPGVRTLGGLYSESIRNLLENSEQSDMIRFVFRRIVLPSGWRIDYWRQRIETGR